MIKFIKCDVKDLKQIVATETFQIAERTISEGEVGGYLPSDFQPNGAVIWVDEKSSITSLQIQPNASLYVENTKIVGHLDIYADTEIIDCDWEVGRCETHADAYFYESYFRVKEALAFYGKTIVENSEVVVKRAECKGKVHLSKKSKLLGNTYHVARLELKSGTLVIDDRCESTAMMCIEGSYLRCSVFNGDIDLAPMNDIRCLEMTATEFFEIEHSTIFTDQLLLQGTGKIEYAVIDCKSLEVGTGIELNQLHLIDDDLKVQFTK